LYVKHTIYELVKNTNTTDTLRTTKTQSHKGIRMNGFELKADFATIPNIKVSYNIGCLFDVPTGTYVKGKYGESILNGGLGAITGICRSVSFIFAYKQYRV